MYALFSLLFWFPPCNSVHLFYVHAHIVCHIVWLLFRYFFLSVSLVSTLFVFVRIFYSGPLSSHCFICCDLVVLLFMAPNFYVINLTETEWPIGKFFFSSHSILLQFICYIKLAQDSSDIRIHFEMVKFVEMLFVLHISSK